MTMVKICGLSKVEDALAAADAGADFLGIVFEPHSRRCVPLEDARRMVSAFREQWKGRAPRWVGVFANQPVEDVNRELAQLAAGKPLGLLGCGPRPELAGLLNQRADDKRLAALSKATT